MHEFWNEAYCVQDLYLKGHPSKEKFANQMNERYRLESWIVKFAEFDADQGKKNLESGVDLGSDHQMYAEGSVNLHGIDLTKRAVDFKKVEIEIILSHADILDSDAGESRKAPLFNFAKRICPRKLIRKNFFNHGFGMLITSNK